MKKPFIIFVLVIIFICFGMIMLNKKITTTNYWGIKILRPKKIKYVIEENGIDATILGIMYYDSKDIEMIKNNENFQKIEYDPERFYKEYTSLVDNYFKYLLSNENQEILKQTLIWNEISQPNNFYAIKKKYNKGQVGFSFTLLILDVNNNKLYSVVFTS